MMMPAGFLHLQLRLRVRVLDVILPLLYCFDVSGKLHGWGTRAKVMKLLLRSC